MIHFLLVVLLDSLFYGFEPSLAAFYSPIQALPSLSSPFLFSLGFLSLSPFPSAFPFPLFLSLLFSISLFLSLSLSLSPFASAFVLLLLSLLPCFLSSFLVLSFYSLL